MRHIQALIAILLSSGVLATSIGLGNHTIGDHVEGTPTGKMKIINGINTYVSIPQSGRYNRGEAILMLTDIFGLPLINNKLLADQWAAAGYAVYTPDYLFNDSVPIDDPNFDIGAWIGHHGSNVTLPAIRAVQDALREKGVKKFAATGYCFGGLYILLLSQNNEINVGTTAHPSLWKVPDDILVLRNTSHVPFQMHTAELDTFTPALASVVDDVMLGYGNWSTLTPYKYGYSHISYPGVSHGFAVRPENASDPVQIAAKEKAFVEALKWVRKHL